MVERSAAFRMNRAGRNIRSAGAVVFRRRGRRTEFLLIRSAKGHWDFPKGRMEPGEVTLDTVRREAREETGLTDLAIVPGFSKRLRWSFREAGRLQRKQAEYLLARSAGRRVRLSREHRAARWVALEAGVALLGFANARVLLRVASRFLAGVHAGRGSAAARR